MPRLSTLARFEVSGEILSEDTVALLAQKECRLEGVAARDEEDMLAAWDLLSERWQAIRAEVATYEPERLRLRWLLRVLDVLDHRPEYLRGATPYAGNRDIRLTHRSQGLPLWLLDWAQDFDKKPETGTRRRSPHEQFQEYLDATDADDWGVLFNGKSLRLLHDYHKSLTRNYVEADLESIFDALDVDAFRAVWRLFHAGAFRPGAKGVRPIEQLRDQSRKEGATVGKELRFQVRDAIEILGNGFLTADREGRAAGGAPGGPGRDRGDVPGAPAGGLPAAVPALHREPARLDAGR